MLYNKKTLFSPCQGKSSATFKKNLKQADHISGQISADIYWNIIYYF